MIIGRSSTKLMFAMPIGNPRWPPPQDIDKHWTIWENVQMPSFPIGITNRNLLKDIQMIIHLQFGFSQFISFREEDLWNFSQSEYIIGPGSHVEYPTRTKNFVEDHPKNIPAKFGSNWPSGFGEEASNVKSLQTTDDRQQTTDATWWQ
jgi:hypothetical protein